MKPAEFIELVKQMRDAQKRYFRDRDGEALSIAKELERRVDHCVKRLQDTQPVLFDK